MQSFLRAIKLINFNDIKILLSKFKVTIAFDVSLIDDIDVSFFSDFVLTCLAKSRVTFFRPKILL